MSAFFFSVILLAHMLLLK